EPAARDFTLALQLGNDVLRGVDRRSEADADVAAALAEDRGVDADDFAAEIDQRPAGVAGVDRRVGLDEVVIRTRADVAALGADDTRRDGALEAEGVADRDDPFADLELVRIAELRHGKVGPDVDLDDRDLGLGVFADDLGFVLPPGLQLHHDLRAVVDHMIVGEDRAVVIDDEARAQALLAESTAAATAAARGITEEAAPKIAERILVLALPLSLPAARSAAGKWTRLAGARALVAGRLRRGNVDHDGREFFRQRHEIRQAAHVRCCGVGIFRQRRLREVAVKTAARDEADRQYDGRHREDGFEVESPWHLHSP